MSQDLTMLEFFVNFSNLISYFFYSGEHFRHHWAYYIFPIVKNFIEIYFCIIAHI